MTFIIIIESVYMTIIPQSVGGEDESMVLLDFLYVK